MILTGSPDAAAFAAVVSAELADAAVVAVVSVVAPVVSGAATAVCGAALLDDEPLSSLPHPTAIKVQATKAPKRAFLAVYIAFPHVESNRLNS